jgi:hypothetical protein
MRLRATVCLRRRRQTPRRINLGRILKNCHIRHEERGANGRWSSIDWCIYNGTANFQKRDRENNRHSL